MERGDYETAILSFRAHLERDPASYDARFGLARALSFRGQRDEAIRLYTELIDRHPGDPDALLGRGRVLAWEKRYSEAEADLLAVTRRSPGYADAWSALGDLYLWSDRPREAVESYSQWVALRPDDPAAYEARGHAYSSARDFARARDDFYRALALGADQARIGRRIGSLNRIPGALPWQASISYSFDGFADRAFEAESLKSSVRREFEKGSLALEALGIHRFSRWDEAIAADGFLDLWPRAYGNLRVQSAVERVLFPRMAYGLEVFQGFGKGWEASGGVRYLDFQSSKVDFYTASLARYVGNWYLRGRTTFVPGDEGVRISNSILARRYLTTVDDFVQAEVNFGSDGTRTYSLGLQTFLHPRFGVFLGGDATDSDEARTRGGFTVEFITRW